VNAVAFFPDARLRLRHRGTVPDGERDVTVEIERDGHH
jgi:hypothetical protein